MENAYNPEGNYRLPDEMNLLHNEGMYKREGSSRNKMMKNYQTERLHRKAIKQDKFKADSRDKAQRAKKNQKQGNILPKL